MVHHTARPRQPAESYSAVPKPQRGGFNPWRFKWGLYNVIWWATMGWKWGHEQPITERVFSVFMIVVSNMSQPCACLTLNCLGRHELGTTHHEPLDWWGIRWYSQPWDCATSTSLRKVASKAVKPTNWGSFLGIFDDHLFDYPLLSHIIPIIIPIIGLFPRRATNRKQQRFSQPRWGTGSPWVTSIKDMAFWVFVIFKNMWFHPWHPYFIPYIHYGFWGCVLSKEV